MKIIRLLIICFFVLHSVLLYPSVSLADAPEIKAESAIVVDTSHGLPLYEKNTSQQIQPGGLTKIMTAMIAIEHLTDINAPITADPAIIAGYDFSFGNMGILANETLTVKDLLYGMMIYDAGEAAELLAHNLAGGYDSFLSLMNQKAAEIGAANTHFTNASGYYDPAQVSTAADLYRISSYAMQNQMFQEIVSTTLYEIPANSHYKQVRYLSNTNQMLSTIRSDKYYNPSVKGIKTSNMKDFGYSLSISAKKGDTDLLCIVINSPVTGTDNFAYQDAAALLSYGFENFETVRLASKGDILDEIAVPNGNGVSHVLLTAGSHLDVGLPKEYNPDDLVKTVTKADSVSAPIKEGQPLGSIAVSYLGTELARIDLCAYQAVDIDYAKDLLLKIKWVISSPFFWVPLLGLVSFFVIRLILINYHKFLQS